MMRDSATKMRHFIFYYYCKINIQAQIFEEISSHIFALKEEKYGANIQRIAAFEQQQNGGGLLFVILMKQEKVFVRFNHFDEGPPPNRNRNDKRNERKKYAEKHGKTREREAFKIIFDSYEEQSQPSATVEALLKNYPKFFSRESKAPEKENNELLNDYLILYARKFFEGLNKKEDDQMLSDSDPDWNSDDDVDGDLESKTIDKTIIDKTVEKMKDKPIIRPDKLKPHEEKFLRQYFQQKRLKQEGPSNPDSSGSNSKIEQSAKPVSSVPTTQSKQQAKKPAPNGSMTKAPSSLNWSTDQQRQLNTFLDMGFMTKIQDNDDDVPIQVVQDDGMFNSDDSGSQKKQNNKQNSSSSSSSSSDGQQDDIFGDEIPTTTVKTKQQVVEVKQENDKKVLQGVVTINHRMFSKIAEEVGLLPARCNWIIRNGDNQYLVSTDYMDAYYQKEKMYEILPLISLNHSAFVRNQIVDTPQGKAILRDHTFRKMQQHRHYQNRHQYRQKNTSHLRKK